MTADPQVRRSSAKLWGALFLYILAIEAYTLWTRAHGDTMSEVVRQALLHPALRFFFMPLWTWLTWHWFLAPTVTPTWRDLIAVALGVLAALLLPTRG